MRGKRKRELRKRDHYTPPAPPITLKEYDKCPKCSGGIIIKILGDQLGCPDCGFTGDE